MNSTTKSVNLNYAHNARIGYGRLGVKLAEAIAVQGVTVYDDLPAAEGDGVAFTHIKIPGGGDAPPDRNSGLATAALWVSTPPQVNGWWDTQVPSVFTMWETKRLPEEFRAKLHHIDTVLVPSQQNVELFGEYHNNVRLVLLGVDPADWYFIERTPPGAFFDFLIGGSGTRKGTDVAFKAFVAAFPTVDPLGTGPIPRLIMKSPRGEEFAYDDRVIVIAGKIPSVDEQNLYAKSHCYLQPSRGEGFGLQPIQAMAQGMPTILTDAHGHEAFAHLAYGIGAGESKADYFIYGDGGMWWEPDFDELVDQMRFVYDNYDEACDKARIGAKVIAEDFTWENTARTVLDAIDTTIPFSPSATWVKPEEARYRMRLTNTRTYDIAGRRLRFEAGKDYWEMADVKRIAAESGHLDPECIEDDTGLTVEQVRRLGRERDPYCNHCGQREGSGLTKADELFLQYEAEAKAREGDADLTAWHAGA
jgi:hypothetical protein